MSLWILLVFVSDFHKLCNPRSNTVIRGDLAYWLSSVLALG